MKAPTLSYAGYCLQQTDSTPFMSVVSWGTDFPGRGGKVGSDLALNGTRKKFFKEKEKKKGKEKYLGFSSSRGSLNSKWLVGLSPNRRALWLAWALRRGRQAFPSCHASMLLGEA